MNIKSFKTILLISGLLFSGCGEVNVSKDDDTNKTSFGTNDRDEEEWDTTEERERFQTGNVDVISLETEDEKRESDATRESFTFTERPLTEPLYEKCKGCHGANGEKVALGKSDIIGGEVAPTTIYQLKEYRAGRLNQYGMGALMKGQVLELSDEEITRLAKYIERLSGI